MPIKHNKRPGLFEPQAPTAVLKPHQLLLRLLGDRLLGGNLFHRRLFLNLNNLFAIWRQTKDSTDNDQYPQDAKKEFAVREILSFLLRDDFFTVAAVPHIFALLLKNNPARISGRALSSSLVRVL